MKPLADGDTAICLFNRSDDKMKVAVNQADYKLSKNFLISDVWMRKPAGTTAVPFIAGIAKHDVVLLRLHKK